MARPALPWPAPRGRSNAPGPCGRRTPSAAAPLLPETRMQNSNTISRRRALQASLVALAVPGTVFAQGEWPTRPVRVIVPSSPGGGTDTFGRILAQALTEQLKQNFVVDNKPGASGNIGAELTARAEPDGYTILVASNSSLGINPVLLKNMPFDTEKD